MQVGYEQKLQSKHGLHNAGNVDLKAWVNWIGMAINNTTLMLRSFVTKHCFLTRRRWAEAYSESC